jgi:arylsulfatase A-like enzyme
VSCLKRHGYGPNPWNDYVMSAEAQDGTLASGWKMRNVHLAARVSEEHSETAYTTDVAIDFIRRQLEQPWCLHLSYIKPHWPYLAPKPYHAMYTHDDCLPTIKCTGELRDPHPVYAAYMQHRECGAFAKDEVAAQVKVPYMGLVSQIDTHIGRLMNALRAMNQLHNTLIVFTSDHGDYLGDHWLGEKDLFHEASARVPMIVVDPEGDSQSRGQRTNALVEAVDFLPTAMEALGLQPPAHMLEGRSLLSFTRGVKVPWRQAAVSEIDYSFREARLELGQDPRRCRGYMVRRSLEVRVLGRLP